MANNIRSLFKYSYFGLPFLLIFITFPVSFAAAESDITFSLDVQEEYSDNFYRMETDKTRVYTTIIKPGMAHRERYSL